MLASAETGTSSTAGRSSRLPASRTEPAVTHALVPHIWIRTQLLVKSRPVAKYSWPRNSDAIRLPSPYGTSRANALAALIVSSIVRPAPPRIGEGAGAEPPAVVGTTTAPLENGTFSRRPP